MQGANRLVIDDLSLWIEQFHTSVSSGEFIVARHDLKSDSFIGAKIVAHVSHQNSAIKLTAKDLEYPINFKKNLISYSGDTGFSMKCNGIRLASGPGISRIKLIHIVQRFKNSDTAYRFIDVDDLIKKYGG